MTKGKAMRCRELLKVVLMICLWAALSQLAHASTVSVYTVAMNTASLVGHPAGPFSMFFSFVDGSGIGDANNKVTVTNVDFGGGSGLGSPLLLGGATGDLETGVAISDSSFLSVFSEPFTAGSTLRFTVSVTTADDAGETPDRLAFFILDNSDTPLPTLAPAGDFFWGIDLGSTGGSLQAFGSDPSRAPIVGAPVSIGAPAVQFVARQVKEAARTALLALLASERHEVREELRESIRGLDASLASDLWVDDFHLTARGERVFGAEEYAVYELAEIKRGPASLISQLQDVARTLARVDQALARTAIDQAQLAGGEADDLAEARKHVSRGDRLASRGEFARAIHDYKDAWVLVQPGGRLRYPAH